MKYLFAIIFSLLLAQPVLAAKKVQGSVPVVQPLQPVPANIAPNLSNNIQSRDLSHNGEFNASGTPGAAHAGSSADAPEAASAFEPAPPAARVPGHPLGWAAVILILLLLGWFWYKQNKAK